MMKRILSLLLLGAMLCLALASCGKSDLDKSKEFIENNKLPNTNPRETLTFTLVTDTPIDQRSLAAMQTAFNAIIDISHKTNLEFINITTAEYATYLNEKFAAVESARAEAEGEEDAEETITPDNQYPLVKDTQFDIFLITSYDMLKSLLKDGNSALTADRVYDMTAFLADPDYRDIKNHMTESFIKGSQVAFHTQTVNAEGEPDGAPDVTYKYFGIPNCTVRGEYTYLLVDEAVAKHYGYLAADGHGITDWASTEALRKAITDDGGYDYSDLTALVTDPAAPVRLVTGQYADRTTFSGCYWYVEEKPTVNASELMESMLAISAYSVNPERAMQILYEINTNSELRTILQYGIPNATYTFANGVVTLKGDSGYTYTVDAKYAGNLFALYPCTDKGETAEIMADWKRQNADITVISDLAPIVISVEKAEEETPEA